MPAAGTGIALCGNGTCGISCNSGYLECVGTAQNVAICQQGVWDFEDMTTGGFRIVTDPSAAEKVGITSAVAHTGKYTFGIQINAFGSAAAETRSYSVGQSLCGGGYVKPKQVTAWMMLAPEDERQAMGPKSWWGIRVYTEREEYVASGSPRGYNSWFPVSLPVDGSPVRAIAFDGYFEPSTALPTLTAWRGFVYVDDVVIE
jgi:hypothetical protein